MTAVFSHRSLGLLRPVLGVSLLWIVLLHGPDGHARPRGPAVGEESSSFSSDDSLAPDLKVPSIFRRPSAKTPEAQLVLAEALERTGRTRGARRAYNALVHQWHASPEAPRAQLGVAHMRERAGSRMRAFREYQYAIEHFSGHFPYEYAINRQFAIADELLGELDRGVLGFRREAGAEQVVQLFRRVARNAPSGVHAPVSYLKMGLTYEADKRYADAVVPYETLVSRFPGHELVADAMFRAAYCRYRMALRNPRDERTLRNALSALSATRRDFPAHPGLTMLDPWMEELRAAFIHLQFDQAEFYDRIRKSPQGALVAYEEFVHRFESWGDVSATEVAQARSRIAKLEPKVRQAAGHESYDGETP